MVNTFDTRVRVNMPALVPRSMTNIDLRTHSILGWPHEGPCVYCGAPAALLCAVYKHATYECRGTPVDRCSAYGPDRCGRLFAVDREEVRDGEHV